MRAMDVIHSAVRVEDDLASVANDDPARTLDVDREPYLPREVPSALWVIVQVSRSTRVMPFALIVAS